MKRARLHKLQRHAGALIVILTLFSFLSNASGQHITEIIDATGDGFGNILDVAVGVAVGESGNVFVSGSTSNNVFKIDPAGTITQILDATGDGGDNTLAFPQYIDVSSAGNVYVSGWGTNNAFEVTPGGVVTQIIDETGAGRPDTLLNAIDVAIDDLGNAFVVGTNSKNAFRITSGGVVTEIIDEWSGGTRLSNPRAVAVDYLGNAYVVGAALGNAFKITPGGTITEIIDATGDGVNGLASASAIAVDADQNVYVTGALSDNAFKISPGGTITQIIDATGDGSGLTLQQATAVVVDNHGTVFVAGRTSDNVFAISSSGDVTQIMDLSGDGLGNSLDQPISLDVDNAGNVYVVGLASDNAFRIGANSSASHPVAGNGGVDFGTETGLDIDFSGVTGSGNVTVYRFESAPSVPDGISEDTLYTQRWVLLADGNLAFDAATEFRIDLDDLPPPAIDDPSSVIVFHRDDAGTGTFVALTTSFESATNEIVATGFTSFSEFALAGPIGAATIDLNVTAILEGAHTTGGSMSTALNPDLPATQPFSDPPWSYGGLEEANPMPGNVVDWLLLEIRSDTAAVTTIARQAVLLLDTGSVVDTSGISAPAFPDPAIDSVFVVLRSRNHTDVMSRDKRKVAESPLDVDFSQAEAAFGGNAQTNVEGDLWAFLPATQTRMATYRHSILTTTTRRQQAERRATSPQILTLTAWCRHWTSICT